MRAQHLRGQILTLFPLDSLPQQRLELVALLPDRTLQLAFGNARGHGIPLEGAVAYIPAYGDEAIRFNRVGVLAIKEVIGDLAL